MLESWSYRHRSSGKQRTDYTYLGVTNGIQYRTQLRNREICLAKLKNMIAAAEIEPKERVMRVGIGEKGKAERRVIKERRSDIKKGRGSNKSDGY